MEPAGVEGTVAPATGAALVEPSDDRRRSPEPGRGIPSITPYDMPSDAMLPRNRASWQPDPARAAVLIHDMQRYFVGFFPPQRSPRRELVANSARIRDVAARLGMPVLYTAQPGNMTRAERGLLLDIWGPGMGADPREREIVPELAPADRDLVITKWRYSAFARSDLAEHLRRIGRDQLVVCGVYAHVGCLMTACDAFTADIEPFLVADALADFSPGYHRMALQYAAERCAVVLSTRQLVGRLTRTTATQASTGEENP